MPRPHTTGAGTALAVADTAWQSIGAGSVPGAQNPVKARKSVQLETVFRQSGQSASEPCAIPAASGRLPELMERARTIGKVVSSNVVSTTIAPFAAPPTR
jgi:hypothetical protein